MDFKKLLKEIPQGTHIEAPIFDMYIMPYGFLTPDPIEHALFFYYVNARKVYEDFVLDTPIIMEDEADIEYDFRSMFISTAALYDVSPEAMTKAWSVIDRQALALNLPLLPNEYQYRFTESPTVLIQ
ncbi:MAG TPA: hypothetical protein ENJ28_05070 [Gammaproteobacteria bacterium]|nr:hypothetical protein [Gammaproteobacteria bacterium]